MLRRFTKDVAIYGGTEVVFRLAQLAALPIYAKLLSITEFGTWALITAAAALLRSFATLEVNSAVQRFYFERGEHSPPAVISTGLVQLVCSSVFVVALVLPFAWQFQSQFRVEYGITWTLAVVGLTSVVPQALAQYTMDSLRLQFAPLRYCVVASINGVGGVLLGLWLLVGEDLGILGLIAGTMISASIATIVGLAAIRRDLTPDVRPEIIRSLLIYGLPLVAAGAAYWIFGAMDRWMLAELSTLAEVGLFSMAVKIGTVLTFIIVAFSRAWSPFAFRLHSEDPDYRHTVSELFGLWFLSLSLCGVVVAFFAPEILRLISPPEYWRAAPTLILLSAAIVLSGTMQFTVLGISFEKKTMLLTYAAWIAAAANFVCNLLLIPRLGALGAAASTIVAYGVLTGLCLTWTQKLHRLPLEWRKLLYPLLTISLGASLAYVLADKQPSWSLGALKVAILMGFGSGAWALGLIDRRYANELVRLLRLRNP